MGLGLRMGIRRTLSQCCDGHEKPGNWHSSPRTSCRRHISALILSMSTTRALRSSVAPSDASASTSINGIEARVRLEKLLPSCVGVGLGTRRGAGADLARPGGSGDKCRSAALGIARPMCGTLLRRETCWRRGTAYALSRFLGIAFLPSWTTIMSKKAKTEHGTEYAVIEMKWNQTEQTEVSDTRCCCC